MCAALNSLKKEQNKKEVLEPTPSVLCLLEPIQAIQVMNHFPFLIYIICEVSLSLSFVFSGITLCM